MKENRITMIAYTFIILSVFISASSSKSEEATIVYSNRSNNLTPLVFLNGLTQDTICYSDKDNGRFTVNTELCPSLILMGAEKIPGFITIALDSPLINLSATLVDSFLNVNFSNDPLNQSLFDLHWKIRGIKIMEFDDMLQIRSTSGKKPDSLISAYKQLQNEESMLSYDFFFRKAHSSFISLQYLYIQAMNHSFSKDSLKSLFDKLDTRLDRYPLYNYCKNLLSGRNFSVEAGQRLPEFTIQDAAYKSFSINNVLGPKPVLIYFWDSYCRGCRKDLSLIESKYTQLQKMDTTVILINADKNFEKWKDISTKYKINDNTYYLSSNHGFDNEILVRLDANYRPFGILVDKNGVILAKGFMLSNLVH